MEEQHEVKDRVAPRGATRRSTAIRYSTEFKLRAVRLVLAEGFSRTMVSEELSICKTTLLNWIEKYRRDGAAGLERMVRSDAGQDKLPEAITNKQPVTPF